LGELNEGSAIQVGINSNQARAQFRQNWLFYTVGFMVAIAMLVAGNIMMDGETTMHKVAAVYCMLFSIAFFSAPFISMKTLGKTLIAFTVAAALLRIFV
jgi:hypothetical protein